MSRTRAGVLTGAAAALARGGTRGATMVAFAQLGGVAKATVYNHFRTREEVLVALLDDRLRALAAVALAPLDPAVGLCAVVDALRDDPALRRLADSEPGTLAPLLVPKAAPGWQLVREALDRRLPGMPAAAREVVLRWLLGHLLAPGAPEQVRGELEVLLTGLGGSPAVGG